MTDRIEQRLLRRSGPLRCRDVGKVLQRYLDQEIDDGVAARIAAHLEDCRLCGLEAATYEQLKAALAARRSDVPSESVERLREFGRRLAAGDESPS